MKCVCLYIYETNTIILAIAHLGICSFNIWGLLLRFIGKFPFNNLIVLWDVLNLES